MHLRSLDHFVLTVADIEHLHLSRIEPLEGPVSRQRARGRLLSINIRDPDGNLTEVANEVE